GHDYTRTKNPTRSALEEGIANLESGDQGLACSSRMAAIQLLLSLFKAGSELLAPEDLYGGPYRLFNQCADMYNVKTRYMSFNDVAEVEQAITDQTTAIFLETPTNPLMQNITIRTYAELAQKHNVLLIVDNTFLTPYF